MSEPPILLTGIPRSGTTWIANVLSASPDVDLVHEPDNETYHPLAVAYKRAHRFPDSREFVKGNLDEIFRRAAFGTYGDLVTKAFPRLIRKHRWELEPWIADNCGTPDACNIPDWYTSRGPEESFGLRQLRRLATLSMRESSERESGEIVLSQRTRFVKSVHAVRCLEAAQAETKGRVCVVLRNPFAVVASLERQISVSWWPESFKNSDRYRGLGAGHLEAPTNVEQVASQACYLMAQLRDQLSNNATWTSVSHDEACRDPSMLVDVASRLGIGDETTISERLKTTVGQGAAYSTDRVAIEQIDRWKTSLGTLEISAIEQAIDHYGLADFLRNHAITGDR